MELEVVEAVIKQQIASVVRVREDRRSVTTRSARHRIELPILEVHLG